MLVIKNRLYMIQFQRCGPLWADPEWRHYLVRNLAETTNLIKERLIISALRAIPGEATKHRLQKRALLSVERYANCLQDKRSALSVDLSILSYSVRQAISANRNI